MPGPGAGPHPDSVGLPIHCTALSWDKCCLRRHSSFSGAPRAGNEGIALFIDYNDLVKEPEKTLKKIYKFLDIPYYNKHNYNKLGQFEVNGMGYDDKVVGDNLHTIKTKGINKTKRSLEKFV